MAENESDRSRALKSVVGGEIGFLSKVGLGISVLRGSLLGRSSLYGGDGTATSPRRGLGIGVYISRLTLQGGKKSEIVR